MYSDMTQSLWALKLEDLLQSETLHPVVIKSNASLFRVGYQRGQLVLVVACEAVRTRIQSLFFADIAERQNTQP